VQGSPGDLGQGWCGCGSGGAGGGGDRAAAAPASAAAAASASRPCASCPLRACRASRLRSRLIISFRMASSAYPFLGGGGGGAGARGGAGDRLECCAFLSGGCSSKIAGRDSPKPSFDPTPPDSEGATHTYAGRTPHDDRLGGGRQEHEIRARNTCTSTSAASLQTGACPGFVVRVMSSEQWWVQRIIFT
jgi:hypothetical protein